VEAERLRLALGGETADGQTIEALLDADGRRRVREAALDDLEPWAADLVALDLTGRPDANLLVAAVLHRIRRHPARALELAQAAHDRFMATSDQDGLALATLLLGHVAWWRGDTDAAIAWWDQAGGLPIEQAIPASLAPFRAAGDLIAEGHLSQAVPGSHHAYAITVAEGSVVDEAHATLLSGLVALDTGALDRSVETLERADDLFAEIPRPRDAALWPLVAMGLGEIAGRRGQVDRAVAEFAAAARRADELGRPSLSAVARAMPALDLSGQVEGDLLAVAQQAERDIRDDDHHWFARQLIERALATALLASGDADQALDVAESIAATSRNALLRAKALLLVARARRALDLDGVADVLDEAIETFLGEGAELWAVEALLERAEIDPSQASASLEQAYTQTGDDLAFERLWQHRPRLVVELSGNRRPVFRVESHVLALGAKGERLAEVVVKAGDAGIHWETVAARLWPDEDDAERIKSRLTSLTSLVRGRLGPDGWRLRRDGPRFQFIALAADIVIVTDEASPVRALLSL
jgi:tetratricopeptide (TPR) repeat protein